MTFYFLRSDLSAKSHIPKQYGCRGNPLASTTGGGGDTSAFALSYKGGKQTIVVRFESKNQYGKMSKMSTNEHQQFPPIRYYDKL